MKQDKHEQDYKKGLTPVVGKKTNGESALIWLLLQRHSCQRNKKGLANLWRRRKIGNNSCRSWAINQTGIVSQ
jgi:hypothetical protein